MTINVTDVDEPPSAPGAPTVTPVTGSSDSLSVIWTAPDNTGKPDIESYDLQYRKGTTGDWTDGPQDETGATATISGLDAASEYQVRVRATNDEGDGEWSQSGSGTTGATPTLAITLSLDVDSNVTVTSLGQLRVSEDYGDLRIGLRAEANVQPTEDFEVTLNIVDVATVAGGDYRWPSSTYAFSAAGFMLDGGRYGLTVSNDLEVIDDDIVERHQLADLEIDDTTLPSYVTAGGDFPTVNDHGVTILNDDEATVSMMDLVMNEGEQAEARLLVSHQVEFAFTVVLEILDNQSHQSLDEFEKIGLAAKFESLAGEATTTVESKDNSRFEPDQTFEVELVYQDTDSSILLDEEPRPTITVRDDDNAPTFAAATATREVAENSTVGTNAGTPVTATDDDGDTLTYTLEGTDAASFAIVSSSGQIQTKAGVTYDHEANTSYSVIVKADDSNGGTDTIAVTINVADVDEPPSAPGAPAVSRLSGVSDGLDVTWTAPDNTGKPDIESYDLQYRKGTTGDWTDGPQDETGLSATITGLDAGSEHQVQVRATNDEGDSDWSAPGSGFTNRPPKISALDIGASIPENSAPNEVVIREGVIPLFVSDADGDTLTYSLAGADAASFSIDASNATIRTVSGVTYDHEATPAHSMMLKVEDAHGGTATVTLNVNVADVDEPPSEPGAPTVDAVSGAPDSLLVTWTAPSNIGKPDIESYDLQYRKGTSAWTDGPQDETGLSATITGLDAGTEYQVRVRATNDEGDGDWSASGSGSTISQADELADTEVPAGWGLIPSGLGRGDRFRLLFRTSDTSDASSSDIAYYNTFVQTAAGSGHADIQGHSAVFKVLGSTGDTDARDNTNTTYAVNDKGVRIYWLNGSKVADDYEDFYDGSWSNPNGGKDENGLDRPNPLVGSNPGNPAGTFTGSQADGTEDAGHALGATRVTLGQPLTSMLVESSSNSWAFYGLSGVFVVEDSASADATLSALSLSGVTLSPGFAADTLTYTASVDNAVDSTTVTATANDDGATVVILPADAADATDGHQAALAVGDTAVSVAVTAEDGTTTQTYTVTVTRADAAPELVVTITADPTTVNGGGTVQLNATVTGASGAVTYAWRGLGRYSNDGILNPVWTAHLASSNDVVTILELAVFADGVTAVAEVGITVRGNQAPEVSLEDVPTEVDGGEEVSLTAAVTDPEGDGLTYAWTSSAGGSFDDASAAGTTWTAPDATRQEQPVTLTLTVTDDGAGTRSTTQSRAVAYRASQRGPDGVRIGAASNGAGRPGGAAHQQRPSTPTRRTTPRPMSGPAAGAEPSTTPRRPAPRGRPRTPPRRSRR